jgi:hypothetical protein
MQIILETLFHSKIIIEIIYIYNEVFLEQKENKTSRRHG